jgi:Tfp pilus assembly protein FimV
MTTITLGSISVGASSTRLRLTVRGRRALAALAAVPAVIAVAIAVVSGGSALASHSDGAPVGEFTTVVVGAGDSLWSIAEEVAPAADPRDVVDAIVRLNALEGANIAAGQRLSVPVDYADSPS